MATINSQFSVLLTTVYTGFLVLLCIARITDSQGNEVELPPKPIDASILIDCPECNNSRPCNVVMNGVSTSHYTITYNGSLVVPANDTTVYGTLLCGGNSEQLKKYIICPPPPAIGQSYDDWLNISSTATMVMVENTLGITASFFHLPHGGISMIVDGDVSSDGDMDCSENTGIQNTTVNYTCTAIRPSINKIIAQVPFCGIDFTSRPLINTIRAQSDVSTSSNPVTNSVTLFNITAYMTATSGSLSSTTPAIIPTSAVSKDESLFMTSSVTMETGIPHGNRNDDDGVDGGVIAAIVITVVVLITIVIGMVVIYYKWEFFIRLWSNSCLTTKPTAIVNAVVNVHVHNVSQPTGANNSNQRTGTGNSDQPAGIGNSNGVCISNDGSSANTRYPSQPVQDDDDVLTANAEDETANDGAAAAAAAAAAAEVDTSNHMDCTSNGVGQENTTLLLANR